jgi:hypothetical protein
LIFCGGLMAYKPLTFKSIEMLGIAINSFLLVVVCVVAATAFGYETWRTFFSFILLTFMYFPIMVIVGFAGSLMTSKREGDGFYGLFPASLANLEWVLSLFAAIWSIVELAAKPGVLWSPAFYLVFRAGLSFGELAFRWYDARRRARV